MYHGTNPTALQSKKMITDALLLLLEKKAFNKINIKEICETALVSRQTFYSHFETKEQVLECYFDDLFTDYTKQFETIKPTSISEICQSAISYLLENESFISILVHNKLNYIMTQKLEQYLFALGDILHAPKPFSHEYAMAFMSGALVETLAHYIKSNKNSTPENLALLIEKILTGCYFQI